MQLGDYNMVENKILEKLKVLKPEKMEKSDKGNALLFSQIFGEELKYHAQYKKWMYFDGKRWCVDSGNFKVEHYAKVLTDCLLKYVLTIKDTDVQSSLLKHVAKLGDFHKRNIMIRDAQESLGVTGDQFDLYPTLLNLQNGVLDLETFELTKNEPSLLLSKICNVTYDETADCPKWKEFIREVMQDDQDKIEYLQMILGYTLTGLTEQEAFWILYGATTRNGKSTLIETISYLLGEDQGYSVNMNPETLAQKKKDSSRTSGDIARLKGARLVICSEPPKRMLFDIGLVKTLTGRDTITARQIYQEEIQFKPEFKLVMNTNYLPVVQDNSLFTSGRVNVITFDRHFESHEQDKQLKGKLREKKELSGILNWLLEGLKKYNELKGNIEPPQAVKEATKAYEQDSDKIGQFINDCLKPIKGINSSLKEVYEVYEEWCNDNGYGVENKGNFKAELRTRNLIKATGTVEGKTCKNIIAGYAVLNFQESEEGEKVFKN